MVSRLITLSNLVVVLDGNLVNRRYGWGIRNRACPVSSDSSGSMLQQAHSTRVRADGPGKGCCGRGCHACCLWPSWTRALALHERVAARPKHPSLSKPGRMKPGLARWQLSNAGAIASPARLGRQLARDCLGTFRLQISQVLFDRLNWLNSVARLVAKCCPLSRPLRRGEFRPARTGSRLIL